MDVATGLGLDQLFEPLSHCLDDESARRVIAFKIDPKIQERVDVLAAKANEGSLTAEEDAEYEAIIRAADFISILKLKARQRLRQISE
jgi:uncharacterized protein YnzC (UPF0291/DUF896 family)